MLIWFYVGIFVCFADERDGISSEDSEKFRTIISEVESLHQLGKSFSLIFICVYLIL